MITFRDHHSGDLFDPWEHLGTQRRRLLDRSWAGVFREHLLRRLPVAELAPHFHVSQGRPSKDVFVVLGALILQQLHDLTDEQTVEALAFHITWHYALDLRDETDAYVCERTLRNYRRIVVEQQLDETLFRTLTDQLIQSFDVDTSKQRLDSTAVRSAIRGLTRLGILVETVSKFLRELKRICPSLYAQVDEDVIRRYLERNGEGRFADTRPSQSRRRLPEAARDVYELIEQFRHTEAKDLESFGLLQRVFEEQCELSPGAEEPIRIREPQEGNCDGVLNPADPDASYNKKHGTGYRVQVMEPFTEDDLEGEDEEPSGPDLITHVVRSLPAGRTTAAGAVGKMTVHDQSALEPAIEDVSERGIKPEALLGDTHYGSEDSLKKGIDHDVEVIAPATPAKGKQQDRLTLEDFELDEEGRVLRCPEGHEPIEARVASIRLQVLFDAETCQGCPHRERCCASTETRKQPRYQYTHDRVRLRRRRLYNATDGFHEQYRWRAGVEATMSRLKHQMGMARLRVRGMTKVRYVTFLRALGLNVRRVAAHQAAVQLN